MIQAIAIIIFIVGYVGISLEHKFHTSKSAIALMIGALLWLLVAGSGVEDFHEHILHAGGEIFEIVIFLLAAMSLVEVLVHYQFFDLLRGKIFALGLSERKQFVVMSFVAFLLSAVIDNLTATIVSIQIARKFFKGQNLIYSVALIVIAANAGGAFSPIGDVTTIMLWLADKFTAGKIIMEGFLPSLTIYLVSMMMILKKVKPSSFDVKSEIIVKLNRSEKVVITMAFASFVLPVIMGLIHLPPYLGLLLGLGAIWIVIDYLRHHDTRTTHLEASIEEFMRKTDIASLKFFVGILLAVSALQSLHILEYMGHLVYGLAPSTERIIFGNIALGALSAILDNVPLTAITIQILHTHITPLWVLLALAVGTGGSLLVVGSAAGVVAMGMVKELTFTKYLQIAFVPALMGYLAGMAVWAAQFYLIFEPLHAGL